MYRDEAGWIKAYTNQDAYWAHNGNPEAPHAELTSGKHSSGFFNSRRIIPNREIHTPSEYALLERQLQEAAFDLVTLLQQAGGNISTIDRVVGPQTGATLLAQFISKEIENRRNKVCAWASPAKHLIADKKVMIFDDPSNTVAMGERVLMCEDVCTTGGSVKLAMDAVRRCRGVILPFFLPLVNRSGRGDIEDLQICALITRELPIWDPDDCPLCPLGSRAITPKNNWAELTASN